MGRRCLRCSPTKQDVLGLNPGRAYRIYPCIMRTFFTTFEAEKLRCALYTEPFVSEALLICINKRNKKKSKENLQKMPRLQRADRGRKAAWPRLEQDLKVYGYL